MDIGPPEIIIVLVLLLVMFGGSQLPKLARNLGKAQQEFKSAMADSSKVVEDTPAVQPTASDAEQLPTPERTIESDG